MLKLSNLFAALFIIFKVSTKLFSYLYSAKFYISQQNRSFFNRVLLREDYLEKHIFLERFNRLLLIIEAFSRHEVQRYWRQRIYITCHEGGFFLSRHD